MFHFLGFSCSQTLGQSFTLELVWMQSCGDVIENERTNEQISIRLLRCAVVVEEDYEEDEAPNDTKLVVKRRLKK